VKFSRIVVQVTMHRLSDSDSRFDVTCQDGSHDAISRRKVLPPGE